MEESMEMEKEKSMETERKTSITEKEETRNLEWRKEKLHRNSLTMAISGKLA